MRHSSKTAVSVARDFFFQEIKTALERQNVSGTESAFHYLVDLVIKFIQSDQFFKKDSEGKYQNHVLTELYGEYLHGTPESKKLTLKKMGDICLLISGFFSDSLNRKLVDIEYYLGMGGSAYWTLSHLHNPQVGSLYQELAKKIRPFSDVLGEVSERSGVQTNRDLLRLYERWLFTGSERLRQRLAAHGITTPITGDAKLKQ